MQSSKEDAGATDDQGLNRPKAHAGSIIDLLIVVDGESFTAPGGVGAGFMFTKIDRAIAGNGTSRLRLRANPGDSLRLSVISTDNQAINAAFIREVRHRGGDQALDTANLKSRTTTFLAACQVSSQASHAPPEIEFVNRSIHYCLVPISAPGAQDLDVGFVLYGPPVPGEARRGLSGEFVWPASVTVCIDGEIGSESTGASST